MTTFSFDRTKTFWKKFKMHAKAHRSLALLFWLGLLGSLSLSLFLSFALKESANFLKVDRSRLPA